MPSSNSVVVPDGAPNGVQRLGSPATPVARGHAGGSSERHKQRRKRHQNVRGVPPDTIAVSPGKESDGFEVEVSDNSRLYQQALQTRAVPPLAQLISVHGMASHRIA